MSNYELKYEDLLVIANKTRLLLEKLREFGGIIPSEQRLEAICAEIEVTKLSKRGVIIV